MHPHGTPACSYYGNTYPGSWSSWSSWRPNYLLAGPRESYPSFGEICRVQCRLSTIFQYLPREATGWRIAKPLTDCGWSWPKSTCFPWFHIVRGLFDWWDSSGSAHIWESYVGCRSTSMGCWRGYWPWYRAL